MDLRCVLSYTGVVVHLSSPGLHITYIQHGRIASQQDHYHFLGNSADVSKLNFLFPFQKFIYLWFKGYVHYYFKACQLYYQIDRRTFQKQEKCFLFHLKNSCCSRDIDFFCFFFLPLAAFLLENLTEIEASLHDVRELHDTFKMQNICNLIGGNSMHIFGIFNCCGENISGM